MNDDDDEGDGDDDDDDGTITLIEMGSRYNSHTRLVHEVLSSPPGGLLNFRRLLERGA